MKYYRIYLNEIDIVDSEKETEKCIYVKGRKILKGGWQGDIFNTFDEAKEELIKRKKIDLDQEMKRHEKAITYISSEIWKAENIIDPGERR